MIGKVIFLVNFWMIGKVISLVNQICSATVQDIAVKSSIRPVVMVILILLLF